MRKYYIFMIRPEFYKNYYSNPSALYKTLENLYHSTMGNYGYALSIYGQLCLTFNTEVLNNYFERKFQNSRKNVHFVFSERTVVQVMKSCIIVLTAINIPPLLKYLLYYNRYLFACDFQNEDFFWLESEYKNVVSRI